MIITFLVKLFIRLGYTSKCYSTLKRNFLNLNGSRLSMKYVLGCIFLFRFAKSGINYFLITLHVSKKRILNYFFFN